MLCMSSMVRICRIMETEGESHFQFARFEEKKKVEYFKRLRKTID